MAIRNFAQSMYDAFETKTRDSGETFVSLKDGSPEWMTEIVHSAHGDMMPDDFRYRITKAACGFIADRSDDTDLDDVSYEFSDDVDVYNASLLEWVSSNMTRAAYVDEALEEYGTKSLWSALQQGQASERREIFDTVLAALREHEETLETSDEE